MAYMSDLIKLYDTGTQKRKMLYICSNKCMSIVYYQKGLIHKIDKPAITIKGLDGRIYTQAWFYLGKPHRVNNPALIYKRDDVEKYEWWNNGIIHNTSGPAVITNSNNFYEEYWMIDGKMHRDNGPAYISKTSICTIKLWFDKNKMIDPKN
jgi:hypothetical protein